MSYYFIFNLMCIFLVANEVAQLFIFSLFFCFAVHVPAPISCEMSVRVFHPCLWDCVFPFDAQELFTYSGQ